MLGKACALQSLIPRGDTIQIISGVNAALSIKEPMENAHSQLLGAQGWCTVGLRPPMFAACRLIVCLNYVCGMPFDGIVYEEAFTWCSWCRKRLLVLSLAQTSVGGGGDRGASGSSTGYNFTFLVLVSKLGLKRVLSNAQDVLLRRSN